MNDISSIAAAMVAMSQSRTQDDISLSLIKMKAEAEQAMANMLIENARQIAALSHAAAGGVVDTFA